MTSPWREEDDDYYQEDVDTNLRMLDESLEEHMAGTKDNFPYPHPAHSAGLWTWRDDVLFVLVVLAFLGFVLLGVASIIHQSVTGGITAGAGAVGSLVMLAHYAK